MSVSMIMHPSFVVIHLLLTAWAFVLWRQGRMTGTVLVLLTAATLVYDNLIISLGTTIGIGSTLEALNVPRYVFHAILTPLLVYPAVELAARGGVVWAQVPRNRAIILGIGIVLIGVGMVQGVFGMHLKPACHDGMLRYAERITDNQLCEGYTYDESEVNQRALPPIASIVTVIIVSVLGGLLGRKSGVWWMLVGAIVMFVTAAVPASRVGLWVGNGGEIALLTSMLFTTQLLLRRTPSSLGMRTVTA